jgi:uncharacterized protein (TIGR03084 family)
VPSVVAPEQPSGYNGVMDVGDVLADLQAEQRALDDIVAALSEEQWHLATPAPGWDVADQIGHLTYFDGTAALAITDPEAFAATVTALYSAGDADTFTLGVARSGSPDEVLAAWRANRDRLAEAAASLGNTDRVAWYGPSMGAKSFLTARLMEVWAHGQDICDTVGTVREPTDRLRHIAQLGVITRNWSYLVRGEAAPAPPVRVELTSPTGDTWSWGAGDGDADGDLITGTAEDFCLVVTQRRHVDDTGLEVTGDAATDWMSKAQAFAGGATSGPAPRGGR